MQTNSHKYLLALALTLSLTGMAPLLSWADVSTAALRQGVSFYNKGQTSQAIGYFQQAVKQTPTSAQANAWLGLALKRQGGDANIALAKSYLARSLELDTNNQTALSNLAELYSWQSESRPQAIALYKRAVALNPADKLAQKNLAQALIWSARFTEAQPYADKVAYLYTKDKSFMKDYATMLAENRLASKAVRIYKSYLNADKTTDFDLRQGYANALLRAGKAEEAKGLYQKLKQQAPADLSKAKPELLMSLGGLAYNLGFYYDSLKYDNALPAKYQTTAIAFRKARAYAQMDRVDDAAEAFYGLYSAGKMTAQERVEFADYLSQAAQSGAYTPKPGLIEALYKQALPAVADKSGVTLRLARYYANLGNRFEDTVETYQAALAGRPSAQLEQELVDYVQSASGKPGVDVVATMKALLDSRPESIRYGLGYAQALSWQEPTRVASLNQYLQLLDQDPSGRAVYLKEMEAVLEWHKPRVALASLYQQIETLNPESKWAPLSLARANWQDGYDYKAATSGYEALLQAYPTDTPLLEEYATMLAGAREGDRRKSLKTLEGLYKSHSQSLGVKSSYANLLAYQGQYDKATTIYNAILATDPENRDALKGKGLALLWGGQKFKALDVLNKLHQQYPQDTDVTLSLAEAQKSIGRYDKAFGLIKEARQIMQNGPTVIAPQDLEPDFNEAVPTSAVPTLQELPEQTLPAFQPASVKKAAHQEAQASSWPALADTLVTTMPKSAAPAAPSASAQHLKEELDILDGALQSLAVLQQRSATDMEALEGQLQQLQATSPSQLHEQHLSEPNSTQALTASVFGNHSALGGAAQREGLSDSAYGAYAQTFNSSNDPTAAPNLLGGTSQADSINALQTDLQTLLRPTIRSGFLYSMQDGDDSTNALRSWAVPNQISLSLTPQVRVRGGYNLRRFWLPDVAGLEPNSTLAHQYSLGTTAQLTDRLTFDGDVALTQFSQSDTSNWTYQARLIAQLTDRIKFQGGMRRSPFETSLLSYTGLRPNRGAFAGQLVGQTRENAVFAELNMGPWKHWDLTGAYEWAWIDGNNTPRNTKNQVYTSLGYTHNYLKDHSARLSYDMLYFGFKDNATNGFFDITNAGNRGPVASLSPLVGALPGTAFGGYFSPSSFFLNSVRLDLKGSLFNKALEYKLGGSLGIQNFNAGVVGQSDPTTLAKAFDGQLIYNINEALSVYGLVDYLSSGGLFSRWRFGGGVIIRPNLPALSPVLGKLPN